MYESRTLILYKIGREYSYVPEEGDAAIKSPNAGDFQIAVNAEMLMLDDREIRERTLEDVGLARVYPDLAGTPDALSAGADKLGGATSISLVTGSYVIKVAVRHGDPVIAAELANSLVENYLDKRQDILIRSESEATRKRLAVAEGQAAQTKERIGELLGGVDPLVFEADFAATVAERTRFRDSSDGIEAELVVLEQRAAALQASLGSLEAVIVEYNDFGLNPIFRTLEASLAARESDYEASARLLGPNHPTVQAVAEEMDLIRRQIAEQPQEVAIQRRESVNPARSQVERDLLATRIEIDDQKARLAYLESGIANNAEAISAKSGVIADLRLLQEKLTLQNARVAALYLRLRESEGFDDEGAAAQTSARVIQSAEPPSRQAGVPAVVRLAIAAALTAALAGAALIAAYLLNTTMSSSQGVEERLKLPVLGEIRRRSRREAAGSLAV